MTGGLAADRWLDRLGRFAVKYFTSHSIDPVPESSAATNPKFVEMMTVPSSSASWATDISLLLGAEPMSVTQRGWPVAASRQTTQHWRPVNGLFITAA